MLTIEGRVTNVHFHKPSKYSSDGSKYLIATIRPQGIAIKGECDFDPMGHLLRLIGDYATDNYSNQEYFAFDLCEQVFPTDAETIEWFLADRIPGIGKEKARKAIELWGSNALEILREEPSKALEIGVFESLISDIDQFFQDNPEAETFAELSTLLNGHKVPKKVVKSVIRKYKRESAKIIKENPYLLLSFSKMGWKTVDPLAREKCGISQDSLQRRTAALVVAAEELAREGHTIFPYSEVDREAYKLLGCSPGEDAWKNISSEIDFPEGFGLGMVGLARSLKAEIFISEKLMKLARFVDSPCFNRIEAVPDSSLNPAQTLAFKSFCVNSVTVLVGPPGTGKTYVISSFLNSIPYELRNSTVVAAPTGNAAKRVGELLDKAGIFVPTKTIHSLLGMSGKDDESEKPGKLGRFTHNSANPLDYQMIIIDELSLCDVGLFAALLDAIAIGTILILVGDPFQLPSVAPGAVLRDLVDSHALPTIQLTEPKRNSGRIVEACHAMLKGICPKPSDKLDLESGENWAHIEATTLEDIGERIANTVRNIKTFDRTWEVQTISAQKNLPGCGTIALNQSFCHFLNPLANAKSTAKTDNNYSIDDEKFVRGDKVVRTKNASVDYLVINSAHSDFDWREGEFESEKVAKISDQTYNWRSQEYRVGKVEVVNGDVGEVVDMIEGNSKSPDYFKRSDMTIVEFRDPKRLCLLPTGKAALEKAYAMTVHKAQGKGFPVCVMPLHEAFYFDEKKKRGLWCRELVYTGFSRAEKLLITVGSTGALAKAISRPTIYQRKTTLKQLLMAKLKQYSEEAKLREIELNEGA